MLDEARSLIKGLPESTLEIFYKLLEGHTEKDIARAVKRSQHSVHAHIKRIFKHFDVRSRSELLAMVYMQVINDLRAKLVEQHRHSQTEHSDQLDPSQQPEQPLPQNHCGREF